MSFVGHCYFTVTVFFSASIFSGHWFGFIVNVYSIEIPTLSFYDVKVKYSPVPMTHIWYPSFCQVVVAENKEKEMYY